MDNSSLVRFLIGASMIRYDVLDQLFIGTNTGKYKLGCMLIDAHGIFSRLYQERYQSNLLADGEDILIREIVIGFWNVVGHYRRYMSTRLGMNNDIFIVFNTRHSKYHNKLVNHFNGEQVDKYKDNHKDYAALNRVIRQAWEFICSLSPYFEGIYCLNNDYIEDYSLMYKITDGFRNDDMYYLIFTKNMYPVQYIRKNVNVLTNHRDKCKLLKNSNWITDGLLNKKGNAKSICKDIVADIMPAVWSLTGLADVSVSKLNYIRGISNIMQHVSSLYEDGILFKGVSFEMFIDAIKPQLNIAGDYVDNDIDEIKSRYLALNGSLSAEAITSDQYMKIVSQCYDIFDENELEHLNEILASTDVDPNIINLSSLNMSTASDTSMYTMNTVVDSDGFIILKRM